MKARHVLLLLTLLAVSALLSACDDRGRYGRYRGGRGYYGGRSVVVTSGPAYRRGYYRGGSSYYRRGPGYYRSSSYHRGPGYRSSYYRSSGRRGVVVAY